MIPLRDYNFYLKRLYDFPKAMDTILIVPTEDEVFSLDDIEFKFKRPILIPTNMKFLKSEANPYPSHTQALQFSSQAGLP